MTSPLSHGLPPIIGRRCTGADSRQHAQRRCRWPRSSITRTRATRSGGSPARSSGSTPTAPYDDRTAALTAHGIAVWDVLRSCRRVGSLDSAVEPDSMVPNDFGQALRTSTRSITRVFFNGAAAGEELRPAGPHRTGSNPVPSGCPRPALPTPCATPHKLRGLAGSHNPTSITAPAGAHRPLFSVQQHWRHRGLRMTAAVTCRACGVEPRAGARFCDACGAPITAAPPAAEYKQVTVLFADVVRSMDMASTLDPERLREIMAELLRPFRPQW